MLERNEVEHNSQDIYYRFPVGAVEAGTRVRIGITLKTRQQIDKVLLRFWHDRAGEELIPMQTTNDPNDPERYYSAQVDIPEKGCLLWYYFIISTPLGTFYYGNNQEQWGGRGDVYSKVPPSYQITVYNKGAKTPDWFKHSVMYQIFPDRFARKGDRIIKKQGAVFHADWNDDPFYYKDPDTKEIVTYDFFGGNFKGMTEKLDYLKDLGISVIYLNPIFESESNHHYDTGDYLKVDPILGTNKDFKDFVQKAKEHGIRVILDGVFSHTGSNSRYFNRKGQYDSLGAFQSKDSQYYEWYNFRNYPYDYECWWNFDTLPDVKETTPSYMNFIINNKNSVLHHWMKEGIAGWRLDVIDELPPKFSQAFYAELKKTDPEAVMIGEVWEDASHKVAYGVPREYLCGQEMDSAMNYPARTILFDFLLGHVDGNNTLRRFESLRENYPPENFYAMMNLIGSHDVERAISRLGEASYYEGMPAINQSRYRMPDNQRMAGLARLMMASLWQMTYPGVPCVYYGDEIGMEGYKDPYNRRPYQWGGGDKILRDYWYKKLIHLRNDHQALQTGELLPLVGDGDILSYARVIRGRRDLFGAEAHDESFIVIMNRHRTETRHVELDVSDFAEGEFRDVMSREHETYHVMQGRIILDIEPMKGMLLEHVREQHKYTREAGVLLHPTSLPSKYGIGDLGKEAYHFIDFLKEAGQRVWQILPLGPVGDTYSPYQSPSAFAGNPLLIDIDELVEKGWLPESEARIPYVNRSSVVDFERVKTFKERSLKKAWTKFFPTADKDVNYQRFCQREAYWLDDYALYEAGKYEFDGKPWWQWPDELKKREPAALKKLSDRFQERVNIVKFEQYLFAEQWHALHTYAKKQGIRIMGDMPIFLAHDSADVWANPQLFDLNPDGTAHTVAGVPPDYFSATGQLWGNPQYNWEAMEADDYAWWKQRFHKLYEMVDIVRIDHFRGFESYWSVDGKAENAIKGEWLKGPGKPFFDAIRKAQNGNLPVVAENLGIITDDVEKLREACGFPGMKVLHFDLRFYAHNRFGFTAPENSVVYTGTHDNNTTVGWYTKDLDDRTRAAVASFLHVPLDDPQQVTAALIDFAYASDARLAIIPMQDLLGLNETHRMNTPGTSKGNWNWYMKPAYAAAIGADRLRERVNKYHRGR